MTAPPPGAAERARLPAPPEGTVDPRPAAIDALTGLRAVAAAWVVGFHFADAIVTLAPPLAPLRPFLDRGPLGVDLFFVLSGFIIAYTYGAAFRDGVRRPAYLRFLQARVARLYPVHFVTLHLMAALLVGAALLGLTVDKIQWSVPAYFSQLALVHLWLGYGLTFNFPAWSISAEWFVYLLFPFAAGLLLRPRGALGAALWATGVYTAGALAIALTDGTPVVPDLVRVSSEFAAGALLFAVFRATRNWRGAGVASLVAPLAVIAGSFVLPPALLVPALGLTVLALAYQIGPLARWLRTPFMVFAGQISYAVYLVHVLVLVVVSRVLPPERFADAGPLLRLGVLGVYLLLIAGGATVLYLVIEQPGRRWIRAFARPDRPPAP